VTARIRRARDVVDGTGPIVTERLATLAFAQLDRLALRAQQMLSVNGALVQAFIDGREELAWVAPHRATVAFPRLRHAADSGVFVDRLLAERETSVVPGRFFEAPAHFRLGFSGPADRLAGGLEALGAALDARAW
jgi:aspartate/methionine/tyrosine aminotransferase